MKKFEVAYLPVGAPTFDLEAAGKLFRDSADLIRSLTPCGVYPEDMLLGLDKLKAFLDQIEPSFIILQDITFANGAFAAEVIRRFSCPVLLWTLREPAVDGTRLRLNSLTGAYSAANAMRNMGVKNFTYIFGSPDERAVREKISAAVRAAELKARMQEVKAVQIGHTPQGFGFGRAMDTAMMKGFGVELESIEARELIDRAKEYSDEECSSYLAEAERSMCGLEKQPEQNVRDFARLYKAYKDYVTENHVAAISSRCWPDFFVSYGTPVCAVLSMLNDMGVAASCEADTYGALSMYMGTYLTKTPVFFGDPVSMDERDSTITFWHCGTAACSLARSDTGAQVGVHCNRHIGPTMEFGCRPCGRVTVFRVGVKEDGSFRFFLAGGEALDRPKQFYGTSVVVRTDHPSQEIVYRSVQDGWEPHFAVIYGDVREELRILGHMLNMEVCEY